ncbi:MAG: protein jag [Chloroflexi bacterium]|nr:protein jag [Chloroflexota bacterium]
METGGRTVEEAIQAALKELGATQDEVVIEVLREGSRGVLGIGAETALVRVTRRASLNVLPAGGEKPGQTVPASDEEIAAMGQEVLSRLLDAIGVRARIETTLGEVTPAAGGSRTIIFNVTGENLGILIGRRGETLRDLQFITRLILSRRAQRWPDIVVDVEHYKARREQALTELAKRMAARVQTSRQPLALEPMPPHERRIIHLALRDHPSVTTESTGEGEKRKVVILPKR